MNKKAIVVYLDNNERNIEEFSWLYKTWMLNELYSEYDLLIYGSNSVKQYIPINDKIIFKLLDSLSTKGSFWEEYPFVNSFAMFNSKEERGWIIKNYDYILKTDCDVFLTKNLLGVSPEKLFIGSGAYMKEKSEEVLNNLIDLSKKLNFKYRHINHIGASLLGRSDVVVPIVYSHFLVTKYIIHSFGSEKGIWPGWYRGVSSMYAIHLVINNFCDLFNLKLNVLDEFSGDKLITKDVYHIHAWHYLGYFSKHSWFNGEYQKLELDTIPNKVNEYCHWIVSNSLEELLKMKNNIC